MTESIIVEELRRIAAKLSGDPDVQKDLIQEMFLHYVRLRTVPSGRTLTWCFQSCEARAQDRLRRRDKSVSLPDRRQGLLHAEFPPTSDNGPTDDTNPPVFLADEMEIGGELVTSDMLVVFLPLLSVTQQQVLFHLMSGCGVRETGRRIGISHPAVIKARKKIARIAHEFLQESEGVGVAMAIHNSTEEGSNSSANGNGQLHAA